MAALEANITTINQAVYGLVDNMTAFSSGLFQFYQGVNQTSQLVFGIPATFVAIWGPIASSSQGMLTSSQIDQQANATIYSMTSAFGGNQQSIGYYSAFYTFWDTGFQPKPRPGFEPDPINEVSAIGGAVNQTVSSPLLDNNTKAPSRPSPPA